MKLTEAELARITQQYAIPAELAEFIKDGTLEMLSETPERHTILFWVPSMDETKRREVVATYDVHWTHPEHKEDMDYGDMPTNFFVMRNEDEGGEDFIENCGGPDMNELDDLLCWLQEARE